MKRDFLDGLLLQHPKQDEVEDEIKANGGLHFLPSSPDGTMHTAIVSFALKSEKAEQPFARAGWRFLFTSSEKWDPKTNQDHPFLKGLLAHGASKVVTVLNNLCLHANMPMIPLDPRSLAAGAQTGGEAAPAEA